MSAVVFGIKNCDTVKKSLKWLKEHNVDFQFEDLKSAPLAASTIEHWVKTLGADTLINKRGTTWRKLPDDDKGELTLPRTVHLIQSHPTLIKRPLVVLDGNIMVGFDEGSWQEFFGV
ncbi:MAG: Spx/MgsR family RNA polymerase-binding regulatory protein [Aliidiomarina sp.]|uniref:Spx/MgsR family RNA polymerase-binding regulatory protein n=1 Tax=Aliidiomarina sp. TaxID=1872439 RepID=UPI0025B8F85D|nr:Spx/MgsR family RNA polymerase-binding regulatory protein [Aliidiomarina sp.]MCH8501989.1 Spx/MgsR family RNA polymerase-binding regulatory protein [Aliidiomarina sp.]